MRIRVLRLIEYSYDSAETMAYDMARWTLQRSTGEGRVSFKSATMTPDVFDDEPPMARAPSAAEDAAQGPK